MVKKEKVEIPVEEEGKAETPVVKKPEMLAKAKYYEELFRGGK